VNTIKAKQVVLALNGYFPEFDSVFKNLITPQRAQMLAVELEDELDCPGLYYDTPERVYWRKVDEKVLVIGGKRLLDAEGEIGNYEKLSAKIQEGLEDYLKQQLNLNYKVIHRWSGIMGFTEHELPMITKIEAPMETYMIGGFSGHGMGLGFRSGQEMAELVTGTKNESFFDLIKTTKIKIC
jgi:glycine/D-amino acid oxidase-like deaminating enzyme